jgi:hypothetical protein
MSDYVDNSVMDPQNRNIQSKERRVSKSTQQCTELARIQIEVEVAALLPKFKDFKCCKWLILVLSSPAKKLLLTSRKVSLVKSIKHNGKVSKRKL